MGTDPRLCGNKAAALARAAEAGLPTPGGFVISADAFAALVPVRELAEPVRDASGRGGADLALLGAVAERAAEVIRALPWPRAFAGELGERLRALGGPLAVRSSATWEDTGARSFAGQLSSVIGVSGEQAVREAVAAVWASAFSPGAISQLLRAGAYEPGPVAVAVQPLAAAELSGVAYSAHPVTGDPEVLVVEAVAGLAGPLVEGRVTPEHVELDRAGRVLSRRPGRQHLIAAYDPAAGAVVERPAEAEVELAAGWFDPVHAALLRAEAALGRPVDIEWCLSGDRDFTLIQVRPITHVTARHPT
ncbi:PEP/pyruvate-binding domain-containing protein [Thermopolyspora sp. NPDC052614]|uniref:PEP/pyruvate-binding domain-containing protein n=1 Tax=Thermopolyspora sp. NPDC052614 TaxID=3155682 RepID=UPI00341FB7EE